MSMWNNLCRACLTSKESFSYFLFENISPETYWFCTSIQIHENEVLPKSLCDNCYYLLIRCTEFKRTCLQSQEKLFTSNTGMKNEQKLLCLVNDIDNELEKTGNCIENETEQIKCETGDLKLKDEDITNDYRCDAEDVVDTENYLEKSDNCIGIENGLMICETRDFKSKDKYIANDNEDNAEDYLIHRLIPEPEVLKVTKKKKIYRKKLNKSKQLPVKKEINGLKQKIGYAYACELCSKRFKYRNRYEFHKLEHERENVSLDCLLCNKHFVTRSGLWRHYDDEHKSVALERLACGTCGRICKSLRTLHTHEKTHVDVSRYTWVCHVCGKRVSTEDVLRIHLDTHTVNRERHYACEHCEKKFFTKATLTSHTTRQHTDRRFICDHCHFPFTDKHNLVKHMKRIHEGTKQYKCDICNKLYSTKSSLVVHKRIHSGERPFCCSVCSKGFVSKRRLRDHHRTHTGEKPHQCRLCELRFAQRGTLQRHMKVHDKNAPIKDS